MLQDVSFEVDEGDFVTLLGASGCGKSTLLRLVAGLLTPTHGEIEVGTSKDAASRSEVGFVFQKPTLCPWLNVLQNVGLPLALRKHVTQQRRTVCDEAIDLVGLHPRDAAKYPSQLSGGMQMRASLARAFVTTPQLMLMDEPFSALDEVLRQQLAETDRTLRAEYQALAERYPMAGLRGLWLSLERFGQKSIFRSQDKPVVK